MEKIYLAIIAFFVMPLFSFTTLKSDKLCTVNQDKITVEAIFDGHEDYGYNFIAKNIEEDSEYTLTFHKISAVVSKEFDLNLDNLIGVKFKITYTTETIVTKDADGYEDEDVINTIIKLEKL